MGSLTRAGSMAGECNLLEGAAAASAQLLLASAAIGALIYKRYPSSNLNALPSSSLSIRRCMWSLHRGRRIRLKVSVICSAADRTRDPRGLSQYGEWISASKSYLLLLPICAV